jgi:hypothetical protein
MRESMMLRCQVIVVVYLILFSSVFADNTEKNPREVSAIKYDLTIAIDYDHELLSGDCTIRIINVADKPIDSIPFILYRLFNVNSIVGAAGTPIEFDQQVVSFSDWRKMQVNHFVARLATSMQTDDTLTLTINYNGPLVGYTETGMRYCQDKIDPEFTILRRDSRAYPVIGVPDWATNRASGYESFDYDLYITLPDSLVAANGGQLVSAEPIGDSTKYHFRNIKKAWRLDLAVAPYGQLTSDLNRIYYLPEDSAGAVNVMAAMDRCMTLYHDWFGPLADYRGFTLIEIPIGWGSQTDVTSIIQTADAFKDSSMLRHLYHEIAHQWNVRETDRYPARWYEGLSTYLEYYTADTLDGAESLPPAIQRFSNYLIKEWGKKPELKEIPFIDYGRHDLTDYSYSYGMLFFATLDQIVGHKQFVNLLGGFYQSHIATGGTAEQFLDYLLQNSAVKLDRFLADWFRTTASYAQIESGAGPAELARTYR